jgi:anti-sigma-K factor RskA
MSEAHVFDLLPGYALGILDEADASTVSRHLPGCITCQKELETYSDTTRQLVLAAAQPTPAPDLKAKVLYRVNSAAERTAPLVSKPTLPNAASPRMGFMDSLRVIFAHPVGAALGVLALVLILFLGANNYLLGQRVNDMQARAPAENMQVVRLAGSDNAPLAVGYVLVFKDQKYGSLAVTHVPLLDADHQYQLWLIQDGKRISGGVFSVNEDGYGNLEVAADRPLDTFQAFGITIEPRGGSTQPTGKKVLGGNL